MSEPQSQSGIMIKVDGTRSLTTVDDIVNFSYVNNTQKNQSDRYKELADFGKGHFSVAPFIPGILLYTTNKSIITHNGRDHEYAVRNVIGFVKEDHVYSLEQIKVKFGEDHPLSRVMTHKNETYIVLEDPLPDKLIANVPGRVVDAVTELCVITGTNEHYDITKTIPVHGMRIAANPDYTQRPPSLRLI